MKAILFGVRAGFRAGNFRKEALDTCYSVEVLHHQLNRPRWVRNFGRNFSPWLTAFTTTTLGLAPTYAPGILLVDLSPFLCAVRFFSEYVL